MEAESSPRLTGTAGRRLPPHSLWLHCVQAERALRGAGPKARWPRSVVPVPSSRGRSADRPIHAGTPCWEQWVQHVPQDAGVPPSALEGHPSTLGAGVPPHPVPRWHSAVSLSAVHGLPCRPGPPPAPTRPPLQLPEVCGCLCLAAGVRLRTPGRWAPAHVHCLSLHSVWEGPGRLPGGRVWSTCLELGCSWALLSVKCF